MGDPAAQRRRTWWGRTWWAAGAFALLAAALLGSEASSAAPRKGFIGATIQNPSVVPDFALRDQAGRMVTIKAERGKLVLLTFLYTECRDVCPLVAGNLNTALRRLGSAKKDVTVLAISVDPVGDTPKAVRRYVRDHRLLPQFHYLIGSKRELAPVWAAYSVVSKRRARGDVDHTLYTLLVDRSGKARVLYDATALPGEIVHDIRLLEQR
jgi:protein SCO1/2